MLDPIVELTLSGRSSLCLILRIFEFEVLTKVGSLNDGALRNYHKDK